MKRKLQWMLIGLFCIVQFKSSAKTNGINPGEDGRDYQIETNSQANPCITPAQYRLLEKNVQENSAFCFRHQQSTNSVLSVPLSWPLRAAAGFTDCSYYYISAHVDHDPAASSFHDYNCGTITYDGHTGTDIAIGPFPFYKMDNNQVEVIAAAAGTIVDKHDGEYDRNCVGSGSGLVANYIIVQHSDGSNALYWHMKSGSLTSKIIGQTVAAGEYLGVVGSSGSSSGCHLHFEVWTGNTSNTMIDPFAGTCNLINATSWWAVQKPYTEPAVVKASVHTTDLVIPPCPQTEIPNESQSYTIPFQGAGLNPGYAKFYVFLRNETSGTTVSMAILNPNSTVFNSWNYTCNNTYNFAYLGYSRLLPTIPGTYTFQATYGGHTCSQAFEIVNATGVQEVNPMLAGISVYPNPSNSHVTIHVDPQFFNSELTIYNGYGQHVKTIPNITEKEIIVNRDDLPAGIYFISLAKDNAIVDKGRFVIAD